MHLRHSLDLLQIVSLVVQEPHNFVQRVQGLLDTSRAFSALRSSFSGRHESCFSSGAF